MKEVGIDISNQKSKDITEDVMRNSTIHSEYGLHGKRILSKLYSYTIFWIGDIEDPKGKSVEKVREIRDEIEQRVKETCRKY